jgi:hypothetical protein
VLYVHCACHVTYYALYNILCYIFTVYDMQVYCDCLLYDIVGYIFTVYVMWECFNYVLYDIVCYIFAVYVMWVLL